MFMVQNLFLNGFADVCEVEINNVPFCGHRKGTRTSVQYKDCSTKYHHYCTAVIQSLDYFHLPGISGDEKAHSQNILSQNSRYAPKS